MFASKHKTTVDASDFVTLLTEKLPPVIARHDVERQLGGLITRQTLANADALGKGPEVAYRVGRKVVYRTDSLLEWVVNSLGVSRIANLKTL
jgi:hypothetical protein